MPQLRTWPCPDHPQEIVQTDRHAVTNMRSCPGSTLRQQPQMYTSPQDSQTGTQELLAFASIPDAAAARLTVEANLEDDDDIVFIGQEPASPGVRISGVVKSEKTTDAYSVSSEHSLVSNSSQHVPQERQGQVGTQELFATDAAAVGLFAEASIDDDDDDDDIIFVGQEPASTGIGISGVVKSEKTTDVCSVNSEHSVVGSSSQLLSRDHHGAGPITSDVSQQQVRASKEAAQVTSDYVSESESTDGADSIVIDLAVDVLSEHGDPGQASEQSSDELSKEQVANNLFNQGNCSDLHAGKPVKRDNERDGIYGDTARPSEITVFQNISLPAQTLSCFTQRAVTESPREINSHETLSRCDHERDQTSLTYPVYTQGPSKVNIQETVSLSDQINTSFHQPADTKGPSEIRIQETVSLSDQVDATLTQPAVAQGTCEIRLLETQLAVDESSGEIRVWEIWSQPEQARAPVPQTTAIEGPHESKFLRTVSLFDESNSAQPENLQRPCEIRVVESMSLSGEASTSFAQPAQAKSQRELSTKGYYRCGCFEGRCNFHTLFPPRLERHLQEVHPYDVMYPCVHCGSQEASADSLIFHLEQHLSLQSLSLYCSDFSCDFSSFSPEEVLSHMAASHPSHSNHICWRCNGKFGSLQQFSAHVKQSILTIVRCPHCSVKDVERKSILAHISSSHPDCGRMVSIQKVMLCQERKTNNWGQQTVSATSSEELGPPVLERMVPLPSTCDFEQSAVCPIDLDSTDVETDWKVIGVTAPMTAKNAEPACMEPGQQVQCSNDNPVHEEARSGSHQPVEVMSGSYQEETSGSLQHLDANLNNPRHDETVVDRVGGSSDVSDSLQEERTVVNSVEEDDDIPDSLQHGENIVDGVEGRDAILDSPREEGTTVDSDEGEDAMPGVLRREEAISNSAEHKGTKSDSLPRPAKQNSQRCTSRLCSRSRVGCLNEPVLSLGSQTGSSADTPCTASSSRCQENKRAGNGTEEKGSERGFHSQSSKKTLSVPKTAHVSAVRASLVQDGSLTMASCKLCGQCGRSWSHMRKHIYSVHSHVMKCPLCHYQPRHDRHFYSHFLEKHRDQRNLFHKYRVSNYVSSVGLEVEAAEPSQAEAAEDEMIGVVQRKRRFAGDASVDTGNSTKPPSEKEKRFAQPPAKAKRGRRFKMNLIQCKLCPEKGRCLTRIYHHLYVEHQEVQCTACSIRVQNVLEFKRHLKQQHHEEYEVLYNKSHPSNWILELEDPENRVHKVAGKAFAQHKKAVLNGQKHTVTSRSRLQKLEGTNSQKKATSQFARSGERKWLVCPYCRNIRKTQTTIEREIRYHIHYKPYGCPYCEFTSFSERFASDHITKTHRGKPVAVRFDRIDRKEERFKKLLEKAVALSQASIKAGVMGNVMRKYKRKLILSCSKRTEVGYLDRKKRKSVSDSQPRTESHVQSARKNTGKMAVQKGQERTVTTRPCIQRLKDTESPDKTVSEFPKSGEKKWLVCPYCRGEKKTQTAVEHEIRYHIHYKPYGCPYCKFTSLSEQFASDHITTTHQGKPVTVRYERIDRKEARFKKLLKKAVALSRSSVEAGQV